MVLSGQTAFKRGVLTNLTAPTVQVQPCGIDITLKAVFKWTGAGVLDFSNTLRKTAEVEEVVLDPATASVHLPLGSYLVEFNELVDMPLDVVGHLYARSSLFRSGGLLHAGVIDSGYRGVLGGLLQVVNPHGVTLRTGARIGQAVFHEVGDGVGEGYIGTYQGALSMQ